MLKGEKDPNTHVKYMVESIVFGISCYWRHGTRSIIHVGDIPRKEEGHGQYLSVMDVQSRAVQMRLSYPSRSELSCSNNDREGSDFILWSFKSLCEVGSDQ